MTKNIPVIFSTDHKFIMPTGVAIKSLLTNSKCEEYEINIIIADDVTEEDKNLIKSLTAGTSSAILFKSIGSIFDGAYEVRDISKATYFRLLIPWLFQDYDKVIYCDGDVIFRSGLQELYNINLEGYYIAGVKDMLHTNDYKNHISALGLNWDDYINAGIMLINSKLWREDNLNNEISKHVHKKYEYQDQDIINLICKSRIKYVSPVYNFQSNFYYFVNSNPDFITQRYSETNQNILHDIKVIHYCGSKPWINFAIYLSFDWYAYYATSPWLNNAFELRTYHNLIYPKLSIRRVLAIIKHRLLDHI